MRIVIVCFLSVIIYGNSFAQPDFKSWDAFLKKYV